MGKERPRVPRCAPCRRGSAPPLPIREKIRRTTAMLCGVHLVAVPRLVVAKAVAGRVAADDLALPGLAELPSSAALRRLRPLELGELVEYAVGELALRAVVSPVVQWRVSFVAVLLELPPEQVDGRLARGRNGPGPVLAPQRRHQPPRGPAHGPCQASQGLRRSVRGLATSSRTS